MNGDRHVRSVVGASVRTFLVAVGGVVAALGCVGVVGWITGTAVLLPGPAGPAAAVLGLEAIFGGVSAAVAGLAVPGTAEGPFIGTPELSADQRRYALAGAIFLNPALVWSRWIVPWPGVPASVSFAVSVLSAPSSLVVVGAGLAVGSLAPAFLGDRWPEPEWSDLVPPSATLAGIPGVPSSASTRLRVLGAAVGVGTIALGTGTVWSVASTTVSGSHAGGGALGLAIAMVVGLFLVTSGTGLFVTATVVRGRVLRPLRYGPDSEYRLVLVGGLLLAVGPILAPILVFFGGLRTAFLPAALGVHMVAVGGLFRLGTIARRRLAPAEPRR